MLWDDDAVRRLPLLNEVRGAACQSAVEHCAISQNSRGMLVTRAGVQTPASGVCGTRHGQARFRAAGNPGEQSDVLRYELLYRYGGVYVDVDMLCTNLDGVADLAQSCRFFAGVSNTRVWELNNAVIGAAPRHPLLLHLMFALSTRIPCCCYGDAVGGAASGPGLETAASSGTAGTAGAADGPDATAVAATWCTTGPLEGAMVTIAMTGPGLFTRVVMSHVASGLSECPRLPAPFLDAVLSWLRGCHSCDAEHSRSGDGDDNSCRGGSGAAVVADEVKQQQHQQQGDTRLTASRDAACGCHDDVDAGSGGCGAAAWNLRVRILPPDVLYCVPNTVVVDPPRLACCDDGLEEYLTWLAAGSCSASEEHACGSCASAGEPERRDRAPLAAHLGDAIAGYATDRTLGVHYWAKSWQRKGAAVCVLP